jgi:hypothetical protein
MPYVGYSGTANLAHTYPAWAGGVCAVAIEGQNVGKGVGGSEVIWMPTPPPPPASTSPLLAGACDVFPEYTVTDGYITQLGNSAWTNGQYIVDNGYIKYMINGIGQGALGDGNPPGPTALGIKYDPTGQGNYGVDDYLTPGLPWEAFAMSGDGVQIGGANTADGGFPANAKVYPIGGLNNYYVILVGNATDGYAIVQYMTYPGEAVIRMKMTYVATANRAVVKIMRGTDPDIDVLAFGTYVTTNTKGFGAIPSTDLVYAVGNYSGKPLSLYVPGNGYTHNTAIMSNWPTYNYDAILAGQNNGTGDFAILGAWNVGAVASGETVSVCCYYICSTSVEEAVEKINGPSTPAYILMEDSGEVVSYVFDEASAPIYLES